MLTLAWLAFVLVVPPSRGQDVAAPEGPAALKQRARIVADPDPPPPASLGTNQPSPMAKSFDWETRWEGWDGLYLEMSRKTPVQDPFLGPWLALEATNSTRVFHLEEVKMNARFGGKLALDGAAFATTMEADELQPGVEVRRARVYGKGDCLLLLPVSYQLELGYIPDEFYIEESYLSFKNLGLLGDLRMGQYQAPMGLDVITSSRDISMMEPAAPLQALAPGVNAGIQVGRPFLGERATWALGLFTDGVGDDFGDASKDYARVITRWTGLPIDRTTAGERGSARFLHLGFSANLLYSGNGSIQYRARPESHLAPHLVDTGEIPSLGALAVGSEIAWVDGPLSIQGEFIHSSVDGADSGLLGFYGFYASAGWFLTGESRPYSRRDGAFARVIPRRNFDWGHGGWGAWELVGRYSYVDLESGDIEGGRMGMLMAGVNWYLHSHIKWRVNYGFGRIQDRDPDGNFHVFQTRVEIDF